MTQPPEAWYEDPSDPTRLRWWDGRQWTGHTAPLQQTQQAPWTSTYLPAYPSYPAASAQPYARAGARDASYRPAGGLAVASIVLVLLVVVTELVLTAVSLPSYNRINDAISEGRDGTDVFTPYDAIAFLQLPLQLAAYVVTCGWLWRVRGNAEALNPDATHARGRGWVWGGWICPVVAWWFPYQVVRDVVGATAHNRRGVGVWWGWFVVWSLLGNLVLRLGLDGAVPVFQGVTALAAVVAGTRWTGIVRAIGRDQRACAERS
jgi:hypothetical protein